MAALLEWEEVVAHARRRRARLIAALVAVDELGERVVERDAAELEPCLVGLDAGERAGEIDDRGVTPPLSRKRSARSTSAARRACQRPRRRTRGSFAAASSESSASVSSTSPIAMRQSNRASASRESKPLERPGAVATRFTRTRLGLETHSRGRRTGTPSSSSLGIASRRSARTWSSSRTASGSSASSRGSPAPSRTGSINATRRSTAPRGSPSRRNAKTSSSPSRRRLAGSASVGSSAASSQSATPTVPPSPSDRRRPTFHGARDRRASPPSTHALSRRSSAA